MIHDYDAGASTIALRYTGGGSSDETGVSSDEVFNLGYPYFPSLAGSREFALAWAKCGVASISAVTEQEVKQGTKQPQDVPVQQGARVPQDVPALLLVHSRLGQDLPPLRYVEYILTQGRSIFWPGPF